MKQKEYTDILKVVYNMAIEDAAFWLENHLDEFKTEDGKPINFCNKKDFIEAFKKSMTLKDI